MWRIRVVLASALAVSLAGCSVITSLGDLEATGIGDAGEEATLPASDGAGEDASGVDADADGAFDDGQPASDGAEVGDDGTVFVGDDATRGNDGSGDVGAFDGTTIGDASTGDRIAADVVFVGDASPADVTQGLDSGPADAPPVVDASADGGGRVVDATADGVSPADAAPSSDSSTGPMDAGDACTPDANSDPNNCGACGHSCQGGPCSGGLCGPVTLATTHGSVGIALDSTYLYWADYDGGADGGGVINKVSKALTHAGTPSAVVSGTVAQGVQGIATDGNFVYWTNKTAGQVHRALPTGGSLTTLATGQQTPDWIASNGSVVAWTNQGANQVMALVAAADGGVAPTQLNTVDEQGTTPAGIAIDPLAVYYATKITGGGLAETAGLDGGSVVELGTGTYVGIAVDTNNVYWTGGATNPVVYQNSKSGTPSSVVSIASGALTCPLAVASDGTNVYFLDQGTSTCGPPGTATGALYRVPVGNTAALPEPLVSGLTDPQGLVVDAQAVYWITGGTSGVVMKLAK